MTGRKNCALQVPFVVPYKALEEFSKALCGATWKYLQWTIFPSCHGCEKLFSILVNAYTGHTCRCKYERCNDGKLNKSNGV